MPSFPKFGKSDDFKPARAQSLDPELQASVGLLLTDFEIFQRDAQFQTGYRPYEMSEWQTVVPTKAPPVPIGLPDVFDRVLKSCWKLSEPKAGAQRGRQIVGTRGLAPSAATRAETYHPQVRPTATVATSLFPNKDAIASDWNVVHGMKRTNAVTFRGDTRKPLEVIFNSKGFHPPISRTDKYYLEKNVFDAFADYLKRRYQRQITQQEFLAAVRDHARSAADQKLLIEYSVWRQITVREAAHVGRMVENECLKSFISTSPSIEVARTFGTKFGAVAGWIYVTIVHGGFVVPLEKSRNIADKTALWGSTELEIAQWGAIPPERIVGFMQIPRQARPDNPIFMRRSFRKEEPKAFEAIYNTMSGWTPRWQAAA